jgi:VIT1/CCC1 family predicted Fe2+/Mn2+ transporter
MAAANFQASKARNEFIQMKRKQEEWEIDNLQDEEKEEIRDIYRKKGFKDELLEEIVRIITSRRKVWVDTMMKEELGLIEDIGIIPLIPFIIFFAFDSNLNLDAFLFSTISVAIAFFIVGMIKAKIVKKSKIRSGIYTLIIGGIAAIVAYIVGYGLNFLV